MSLPAFKFQYSEHEVRATSSSENRVCITPTKRDGTDGMTACFDIPDQIPDLEFFVGKENTDQILSHFDMPR